MGQQQTFKEELAHSFYTNLPNNFGKENFDEDRFGAYPSTPLLQALKETVFSLLSTSVTKHRRDWLLESWLNRYGKGLETLYASLEGDSKKLLVDIIAYRMLGFHKVKLPLNNASYFKAIEDVKKLRDEKDFINPNFLNLCLYKFHLKPLGYDLSLYFSDMAIVTDFVIEQYAQKQEGKTQVATTAGDVVLDIGGCWGDTALYFADKAGPSGKVYSFEFIPNNIEIHKRNTALNPNLQQRITLVEHPVSNVSDQTVFFKDFGPASKIEIEPFDGQTGSVTTISIDDFVERNNIEKVSFIKMDIEGAETMALQGAVRTITKFRPKLAIAIYHSMEDFINLPEWISSLNLGYKFYLGHYTIHAEETILFAKVDD